jgi:hypothetical protein
MVDANPSAIAAPWRRPSARLHRRLHRSVDSRADVAEDCHHMRIDGGNATELECFKSVAMKCKCNLQTAHSALYVARGQR